MEPQVAKAFIYGIIVGGMAVTMVAVWVDNFRLLKELFEVERDRLLLRGLWETNRDKET